MEAVTNPNGKLKIEAIGYHMASYDDAGNHVELRFNPYGELGIGVRGLFQAGVLKGGIVSGHGRTTFKEGGLYQKGLHLEFDDEYGLRRYWITDTDDEEVKVSWWDDTVATPHPQDGSLGGQYGDYSPASAEDTEIIKGITTGMIVAARLAVDSQLASS
jgi:hypothetical protein